MSDIKLDDAPRQWSTYRRYEGCGFTLTVIIYTLKEQGP